MLNLIYIMSDLQLTLFLVVAGSFLSFVFLKGDRKGILFKNNQPPIRKKKSPPPKLPVGLLDLLRAENLSKMFGQLVNVGPLHTFQLPWPKLKVLFINDLEIGKELFQNAIFCGRPDNEFWRYHARGNYGIVTSCGKVWEEQRRFTLRKLKEAGVLNKTMENLIATEVDGFIKSLEVDKGQPICPNKMTSVPFFNTVWVILTGQRFRPEDTELSGMLLKIYEGFMKILEVPQIFLIGTYPTPISVDTLTKIGTWIPVLGRLELVKTGFDHLRTFCVQLIDERQKMLNRSDMPQSFIEDYLLEIEGTTNEKSTFYKEEGVKNLISTIADLFIAGGETAANVLSWAMIHLIRNPEVQKKIQAELDQVVGRERRPTLSDRPNCPYCNAFLNESLRVTPASLFSLPHMTTDEVDIGPYIVEKHTTVVLNIAAVHADPKIWGDPEHFRPERFLSPDGKQFIKNPAMVAFSVGRRKCPAVNIAMDNLFLFVSAICHKFVLKQDPNLNGPPPLMAELSGLNTPKPFYMVVEDRSS